jgi:hypothetical protein
MADDINDQGGLLQNVACEKNAQGGLVEQNLAVGINDHGGGVLSKLADEMHDHEGLLNKWLTK